MYDIDDLIAISALQHYAFCPRQCALIHIEQVWSESVLTAEGRLMHERVHEENRESRGNIRIESGMPLRSLHLGLIGIADVVEFHRQTDGSWLPFPVEYKRGKPKRDDTDRIQLCAQALCLEEMLNLNIPSGALFYGKTKRREDVGFTQALRTATMQAAEQVHALIASSITPPAVYAKHCDNCSLIEICLPKTVEKKRPVKNYLARMVKNT